MELPSKVNDLPLKDFLLGVTALTLGYEAPLELRRQLNQALGEKRIAAAVCILWRGRTFQDAEILLTLRSSELSTHAGQVAFPGGVMESVDLGDLIQAALRETEEEIGISKRELEVLGGLPPFPTVTGGFEVTPVIALAKSEAYFNLKLSDEVSAAEWVSVGELFKSRQTERRTVQGVEVESPFFWWGNQKMWGVSAWIFDLIYQRYGILISKENT